MSKLSFEEYIDIYQDRLRYLHREKLLDLWYSEPYVSDTYDGYDEFIEDEYGIYCENWDNSL